MGMQGRPGAVSGDAIDLTEAEAPAAHRQEWGRPGRCPTCGEQGYLDRVDLVNRVMFQHCTNWECRERWETTEAELATT